MTLDDLELLAAITIGAVLTAASGYAAGAAVVLTLAAGLLFAVRQARRRVARAGARDEGAW
jgi:hypothetical protein